MGSAFSQNRKVGKEISDTMFFYSSESELKTMEVIYDFLQLDLLINPECSFISNATALAGARTLSQVQDPFPKTFNAFRKETFAVEWDACLCVAGTERTDRRRMVSNYSKEMKVIVVNFPGSIWICAKRVSDKRMVGEGIGFGVIIRRIVGIALTCN